MSASSLYSALELQIERLDHRGRGIAMHGARPVVCDGALPGEVVSVTQWKPYRRVLLAQAYTIIEPIEARVTPLCRYFGECGGCQLQQARYDAQVTFKENQLRYNLEQTGNVRPVQWLPSLTNDAFHYRRRVRLAVRMLSNGEIIIGFHRKHRTYLFDIQACPILDPRLHSLLEPLHRLVPQLSVRQRLPQIEMSCGDREVALVFRHLLPLSQTDRVLLQEFAELHQALVYTQATGPESMRPLLKEQTDSLQFSFPRHQLCLRFAPAGFIQGNAHLNELLVDTVMTQLNVQEQDVVLDLFCGIGNFSLPLARYARTVIGVEGHPVLIARARSNADVNGLHNVQFRQEDLRLWSPDVEYNKIVLDPPREGAIDVIKRLPGTVQTIVYVSCMPKTLARDARYLVHRLGYRLIRAGLVDMFPQTKHIEAVAVFQQA